MPQIKSLPFADLSLAAVMLGLDAVMITGAPGTKLDAAPPIAVAVVLIGLGLLLYRRAKRGAEAGFPRRFDQALIALVLTLVYIAVINWDCSAFNGRRWDIYF